MKATRPWLAILALVGALAIFASPAFAKDVTATQSPEINTLEQSLSLLAFKPGTTLMQDVPPTPEVTEEPTEAADPTPAGTDEAADAGDPNLVVTDPAPAEMEVAAVSELASAATDSFDLNAIYPYKAYIPSTYTGPPTFYVSVNGSDSNPGTFDRPWRTLQKAADTVTAGQTVKILPGTYWARLVPTNSGRAGEYITYTADPGTVVLDGSGVSFNDTSRGDGLVQIQGKSYIRVQNLTLRNSSVNCVNVSENANGVKPSNIEIQNLNIQFCRRVGIRVRFGDNVLVKNNVIDHINLSSGVGVWWSNNIIVDGNTITNAHYYHVCQGAYDEALTISSTSNFEVKNNTLDNTKAPPPTSCTNLEKLGIDVKESSQNGKVYRNTIRNMNAAAIYVDGWHAGANGTPTLNRINIYQNVIVNSAGIVVGAEQADGVVEYINIYNNVLINTSFTAINVRGAYGNGLRKNINIYNNTIYGANPSGGNGGGGIVVGTTNLGTNNGDKPVIIRNNISMFYFIGRSNPGTVGQIRAGNSTIASKIDASHNLVYGPQNCSYDFPNCVEVGSRITADPSKVFVNPGAFDLHLRAGSPAIDSGAAVGVVTTDFDGYVRPGPSGSAFDIGAYEYR